MTAPILAWHFLAAGCTLGYGDGRVVGPGSVVSVAPDRLDPCRYGLHASVDVIDALQYAPGPVLCRVELSGQAMYDWDKLCAETRRVVWMSDPARSEAVLRTFARRCAADVIHLWAATDVARRYLATGDEEIRADARADAKSAARGGDRATTMDAASAAASAAARAAAGVGNRASSAWVAAWAITRDAAMASAWAITRDAAMASTWATTLDADLAASRARQRRRLVGMMARIAVHA